MRLKFFIHPKLSELISSFTSNNDRIEIVEQGSIQLNKLLMQSSMLITDYSSVCWDELYMEKPVLFYHFDADLYEAVTGSYIDLSTDLPGPKCATEEELLRGIEHFIDNGFVLDEHDRQLSNGWFENRDSKNRERTFNFLENEGF